MFRFKSSENKDLQNKQTNQKNERDVTRSENKETIPVDISKVESICYKKCIHSLNTPSLSYAEKNCLDRCAYKFKEAVDYGHNLLLYINHKVRDSNNNPLV